MEKSFYRYLSLLVGPISALFLATSAGAATLTVNSAADSGGDCPGASCTLRQAILSATPGDTINFAAAITTIDLTSNRLIIDRDLTISGPGPNQLTVQRSSAPGTASFRIFSVLSGVDATLSGLTIRNGSGISGSSGGAIFNTGTLTINACTISDNVANDAGGGAIFNNGGSPTSRLTINNSTISGNATVGEIPALEGGGGIEAGGGRVTITNSTISGNSQATGNGGGIYLLGVMTITNSTVSGNSANNNGKGGGIYADGILTITNSTVAGNSSTEAGGIHGRTDDLFKVANTIIATNTAATAPDVTGRVTSQGYILIGNTSGATIVGFTGDQLDVDPILGPLQDNGGPTKTQALLFGSPAIDKGHSFGSVTDQRGFTRPVGSAQVTGGDGSDIGAFEVQGVAGVPGTLGNISTRLRVLSGDNALIGGMIATGTAPKRVIIRAIGPSLIPFGVPGTLANPTLDLFQGSTLLFSNDDWNDSTQQAEIAASGLAPSNTAESAIIWTLTPGQTYTAAVHGSNGTTGIGVVEAFDLDPAAASKLGNISTRGFVDVDDNVMIAGLIAGPSNGTSLKILVRALGPTLSDFGVPGALANPTLDLVNPSGTVIRSNNDWKDDPQQRPLIEAAGLAPSHDEEAALVETVTPGAYTAVVRGSNQTTGVGLVEVYNIQ